MKPEVLEQINRIFLEMNFDPDWVQDEDNEERLEWWARRHPDYRWVTQDLIISHLTMGPS